MSNGLVLVLLTFLVVAVLKPGVSQCRGEGDFSSNSLSTIFALVADTRAEHLANIKS
jgi:hypothetical protein